ncbi:MAG: TetR/AcrR family transcriptional regulator [Pseudomonadota bacterium]|nr:TetR/AcrR family transcriptional regulator [Pseudomonadota bacterium]
MSSESSNGKADAMPVRRREMAKWRRQRILDAALAVFGSKGVDGASMKEVAAEAGVAPGLLYHYFAGKEALSMAVTVERGFLPELRELLSRAKQRPAAVVLPEVAAGFDRMLSERSALLGLWTSGAANPKIRRGLEEILRETHRLLGKYLTDRVAAGELRPHDSRAVVQALFASCAFGHGIGQPVDPLAVAHIVLEGIAVTRAAPADAAPVLRRRVRSAKKSSAHR